MLKKIYRFLSPKHQTIFLDYPVEMIPRYGHGMPPHQGLYEIVNRGRAKYENFISSAIAYKQQIASIPLPGNQKNDHEPTWNNGFLPGLDIVAIYTVLAEYKPKRYLEIGSGNSTKVAFKAKQENALHTEIISIDPMPRAEIDDLADQVIRKPFEDIDFDIVEMLEPGDVLFVDNSHRVLPNSDAMVFFMEILPRLKKGVIVHIHDIYIPYDYPQFMCDRSYSEQYTLAAFILANPEKYNTLFPCYFVSKDSELSQAIEPLWESPNTKNVERHGGSYWLQIA